ncbi:MAG: hypothetical protein NVSMB14_15080 [Isosphaeraceae bacterium]
MLVQETVASDMDHLPCDIIDNDRATRLWMDMARRAVTGSDLIARRELPAGGDSFIYLRVGPTALAHLVGPLPDGMIPAEFP